MKIGGPLKGQINLHRSRLQKQKQKAEEVGGVNETHAHRSATKPEAEATLQVKSDETETEDELKMKEAVPALVHNDKSAMLMQAFEVAKEEAAGTEAKTLLGDMEVTLTSIKPTPVPVPVKPPPMTMEESTSIQDLDAPPPLPLSNRSPTSQFEYDVMNATHQNLDFDHLQKSYSYALMDEDEGHIDQGGVWDVVVWDPVAVLRLDSLAECNVLRHRKGD